MGGTVYAHTDSGEESVYYVFQCWKHLSRSQSIPDPKDSFYKDLYRLLSNFTDLHSGPPPVILLTEVLHPADPRQKQGVFDAAHAEEISGIFKIKALRVVCKEEIVCDANILCGRFVLSIKDTETDFPLFKARFFVQEHIDAENTYW